MTTDTFKRVDSVDRAVLELTPDEQQRAATQTELLLCPRRTPINAPLTEVHLDPEQVEEWRRQFTGREEMLPL
jgi:hypothetical protein